MAETRTAEEIAREIVDGPWWIGEPQGNENDPPLDAIIAAALATAREEGRREGLEEAARIAETDTERNWPAHAGRIAHNIRALISQPNSTQPTR